MLIHLLSMPVGRLNADSGPSSTGSNPAQQTDTMFMKLLTAQLKNQSPLNPVDPTQFTSQLVQFNMLDQLTQINSVLRQMGTGNTPPIQPNGNSVHATPGGN